MIIVQCHTWSLNILRTNTNRLPDNSIMQIMTNTRDSGQKLPE